MSSLTGEAGEGGVLQSIFRLRCEQEVFTAFKEMLQIF